MRITLLRAHMTAVRSQTGQEESNILEISKTNPWLEKQLQQLAARLSGVKQLLSTLNDELEKSESGKHYGDHQRMLDALARYQSPEKAVEPEADVLPMEPIDADQAPQPAWTLPGTPTRPDASGWETAPVYAEAEPAPRTKKLRAPQGERQEPAPVRYELAPDEKQTLDMIKATLYNIDVKLDDFERRLNYMDKYVEGVQKQQLEKFNAQNEIVKYEARKARYAGIGISAAALALVIMLVMDWWLKIFDPIRRMLLGA
jgi:septal ring factor EnvC (AmiA/AmiB activator)